MRDPWLRQRVVTRCTLSEVLLSLLIVLFPPAASANGGSNLIPRRPTLFHLADGDSIYLTRGDAQGKHAEIFIEPSAPGAKFVVLAPDGRQLQVASADDPEWLTLSFPFAEPGQYRLLARAKPAGGYTGAISFRAIFLPDSAASAAGNAKAEAMYASAQTLSRSPKAADLRQAIAQYKQAGATWAASGNNEGQILALAGEARARLDLSEYDNATAALYSAAHIAAATHIGAAALYWHAWLADLQAQVYLDRWDSGSARKDAEEALRLSRQWKDDWLTADTLADRGESEYLTHNPSAEADLDESLRLARASHAIRTMARALRCKSWIEKDQGHLTRAFALQDQAREYFHQDGDMRAETQAMSTLATIDSISGDVYSALLRHTQLSAPMRDAGYAAHYAILLDNIGGDYDHLNRVPDAIVYYEQALAAYKSTRHTSGEAIALLNLCSAEMRQNRMTKALNDCETAIAIDRQFNDPKRLASSIWQLGTVQRTIGQTGLAIDSFRRATKLADSVHDAALEAQAVMDWGDTLETLGRREQARELFEKALPLSQTAEDTSLQLDARYRIARAQFEASRDEDAKHNLKIALDSVEAHRRAIGNTDLQASYFAQERKCLDLYVEILMHDPSTEAATQALEVSESGRARGLLDTLAARDSEQGSRKQATASQQLLELHLAVERAYDQRLKVMLEGGRNRDPDPHAAALTQAIDMLERAEDEQNASTPVTEPPGRTLSAAAMAADGQALHSTFLEYALGDQHSYVWVIDRGKIESHILPGRDRIASMVKQWRALATARLSQPGESFDDRRKRVEAADRELPRVAASLSCMLLGPVLDPAMKHLAIVPDGELTLLPFPALPENGCQGGAQPIAAEREVVLTPSLSVLLLPHAAPSQSLMRAGVAIFADPVFDLGDPRVPHTTDKSADAVLAPVFPRLIGTREEAKAIAELAGPQHAALYLDFNASLPMLLTASLSNYSILHLATHGVVDESTPGFSGIVLSLVGQDGHPIFGYLQAHDIARLDLRSDLVVLSSCDTASGVNLSGEGVIGLTRGFLSAGARRVVSALWSVDDETSRDLMTTFYSGMLREGLDPSEALRRSQAKMLRNSRTAAPYYWAGFIITSTTH
jgi:tetratricopeptide (TPR) repeat protein